MKMIPVSSLPQRVEAEQHEEWLSHPLTRVLVALVQLQQALDKEQLSKVDLQTLATQPHALTESIVRRDYTDGMLDQILNAESMQAGLTAVHELGGAYE